MKNKAIITPNILRWARETSKMSIETVALKIKVKEEKIDLWEKGDNYPTINQLEKLSKLYRRPISVFYLPEPPSDFQTLRDFRKSRDLNEYSTALTFIIRDIQLKQFWLSNFLKEESEQPLDFIGKFNKNDDIKLIAKNIKEVLEIDDHYYNNDTLRYWIDKIEQKGIFVSLTSNIHSHLKIDVEEVKGFAITDKYAPFIFINSADSKNSQLFSLIHELAHLWINVSGVSAFDFIDFRDKNELNKYDPLEVVCNKVAAEILMPEEIIRSLFKSNSEITHELIEKKAREINVSSFALLVRLVNMNIISTTVFNSYKKVFNEKYEDYLERQAKKTKKKGGPSYYILKIRKNSRAFTSFIYGNYKSGKISGYEANKLLDIKVSNFKNLEKYLYA